MNAVIYTHEWMIKGMAVSHAYERLTKSIAIADAFENGRCHNTRMKHWLNEWCSFTRMNDLVAVSHAHERLIKQTVADALIEWPFLVHLGMSGRC